MNRPRSIGEPTTVNKYIDVEGAIKSAKLVWAKASDEEEEEEDDDGSNENQNQNQNGGGTTGGNTGGNTGGGGTNADGDDEG